MTTTRPTGAAAVALAAEAANLRDLAEWHHVGAVMDRLWHAIQGADTLSTEDAQRIRRWAWRWRRLAPALRQFYGSASPRDEAASIALYAILEGEGPHPAHVQINARIAWDRWSPRPPPCHLAPRLDQQPRQGGRRP